MLAHQYHLSVYLKFLFDLPNYKCDMKHAENEVNSSLKGEKKEFPKTSVEEVQQILMKKIFLWSYFLMNM